jgi:hypothetical protein
VWSWHRSSPSQHSVAATGHNTAPDKDRCVAAPGFWEDFDGAAQRCEAVAHQHDTDPGLTCTHQWSSRVKKCAAGYTLCLANPTFSISVSGGSKHWSGIYTPLANVTCYGQQVYQAAQCGEGNKLGVDRFPPAVMYWEGTGNPTNWMIQKLDGGGGSGAKSWLNDLARTGRCGDSGSAASVTDNLFGRWKEVWDNAWQRSTMKVTSDLCSDGTTPDPTADKCTKEGTTKKAKRKKKKAKKYSHDSRNSDGWPVL